MRRGMAAAASAPSRRRAVQGFAAFFILAYALFQVLLASPPSLPLPGAAGAGARHLHEIGRAHV